MSQLFSKIKVGNSKRSTFDLSHHQVTTSDFGYLIPICYRDMVPNDDFVVKPEVFVRLAPLASPTYGNIVCRVHHFFVPYRILYPQWDAFIVQDASNHTTPPYFKFSDVQQFMSVDPAINPVAPNPSGRAFFSRLMSNLGLDPRIFGPDQTAFTDRISAFPFLAYYRIWMDYFMDSNISSHSSQVESFFSNINSGGELDNDFVNELLKTRHCCYKKDYFTTAKVSPQAGNASLVGVGMATDLNPSGFPANASNVIRTTGGKVGVGSSVPAGSNSVLGQFTIEALRAANAAQRYSERSNFVGSKIINQILAHFGVAPTPERLDMAEFLGGDSFPVRVQDVTSTSGTSSSGGLDNFGLGSQAGKGIGGKSTNGVRYHAKEHGVFMSLMSIIPDTGYYQGVSRFWTKGVYGDALDYYTPEFENLGFQEVLNKEVYVPLDTDGDYPAYNPNGIFGYQPRFSEYKFQQDVLGSDFVTNDTNSTSGSAMDSFHLFRHLEYDTDHPLALNSNFVELNNYYNTYDRIFQVTNNKLDHFYFNIDVDVKATRDMTGFAEPSLDSTNNTGDGNMIELPYGGTRL